MSDLPKTAKLISKETGTVLLGAATGILVADLVSKASRKPLALIVGGVGAAALSNEIATIANKLINGPTTKRGSERTLKGIREGGSPITEDEVGGEMFIG